MFYKEIKNIKHGSHTHLDVLSNGFARMSIYLIVVAHKKFMVWALILFFYCVKYILYVEFNYHAVLHVHGYL